jgi:CRISPR-associated protein Csb1
VEEALLAAHDGGRLDLPLFELRAKTDRGEIRLTSLEFPHRYADAYLRDSEVDGQRFDKSVVGRLLRSVSDGDVCPLFQRDPGSLLFGAWDSHRKGRWPKFPRIYSSQMFGVAPLEGERRGGRMDPMNLTGGVDSKDKAEANWTYTPEGTKAKGGKLSEIGHGNIAPNWVPGGVTVRDVRRNGWVSIAGLERLRFGDAPAEAATLARATLAALALAGDRLAFGRPSLWLRSGCDLTRVEETVGFEHAGGRIEQLEITAAEAIAAFQELRRRAAEAGVAMDSDTIAVTPIPQLAEAISFSVSKAAADAGE